MPLSTISIGTIKDIIPIKKKIKINIHPKLHNNAQVDDMSIYELTRFALANKILVQGTHNELKNDVKRVHHDDKKYHCIANFFMRYLLFKTGEGVHARECANKEDFVTGQNIVNIPFPFIFCMKEGTYWYGFDIRSLYEFYNSNPLKFINPYTCTEINKDDVQKIFKKLKWLSCAGFPSTHYKKQLNAIDSFNLYVVTVFQKLNQLGFYADYKWFMDLNMYWLKKLYCEVADIWEYRSAITNKQRNEIVNTGVVFADHKSVQRMNQNMEMFLRKNIVRNLERLITEGCDIDSRKLGGFYFMLGLVLVSAPAAECNQALYMAASSSTDDDVS